MFGNVLPRTPTDRFLCYEGDEGEGGEGEGGSGGGEGGKTFTQAELDAKVQDRVGKADRANSQKVADALGMSLDEAKTYIAAKKAADDKDKSEAQLAREKADAEKAEAIADRAAAKQEKFEASVERALNRAGLDVDNESRLKRALRSIDLESDADVAAIKAAVESLKKEEPTWFGSESSGEGDPPPPGGESKGKPTKSSKAETGMARGAKRAEEMLASQGAGGYNLPGLG